MPKRKTGKKPTRLRQLRKYEPIPPTGSFIGWKAVIRMEKSGGYKLVHNHSESAFIILSSAVPSIWIGSGAILKLKITGQRTRLADKNRCSRALVLGAYTPRLKPLKEKTFLSSYDDLFVYTVGEVAKGPNVLPRPDLACSSGIHFFRTAKEAVAWATGRL